MHNFHDYDELISPPASNVDSWETADALELFPWSSQFETGIGLIDEQHRTLVGLLNSLARQLALPSDPDVYAKALSALSDYASYHFESEENLMRQFLPGDDLESSHQLTHQNFLRQIGRLSEQAVPKPEYDAIKEIVTFLCRWLAFHILDVDQRMAKVILAVQAGVPLEQAKVQTDREVSGAARLLIDSVLVLFEKLSSRTLQVMNEIVERKRMEEELRVAKEDAERANSAKSRFLAAASHDLRQPLSALSIYVDVVKSHVAAAGLPMLSNMQGCIGSLTELLTDLLDLSKLEADVVTPNLSHFSLAGTLAQLVAIHAPEAQLKGLRLRCVTSKLTAHTDPVWFSRIVGNLIHNAIRYTERGSVLIGCRRRQGKTWLEIWDTGIGIPDDKTAEIFEEFKQLGDHARNSGSGLGLAIVVKTAVLLGLEISVRSWPGRGSVFAIEVPLGQSVVAKAAPEAEVFRPLRVALVEDNPMVLEALVLGLQSLGHQVLASTSKAALLVQLDPLPPDIVVSEHQLTQGETGFDVITAVRESLGVELPAILITGDTDTDLLCWMTGRGIAVLHKPLDLETLQAYLEDLTCRDDATTSGSLSDRGAPL